VRLRARSKSDKDNWLLIKEKDDHVRTRGKLVTERETTSVKSGRSMEEIAGGKKVWHSSRKNGASAKAGGDPIILSKPAGRTKAAAKRKTAAKRVKKKTARSRTL
jgi:bifunctional non-homologous end joining protein LigD